MPAFDGDNLVITLDSGVIEVDVMLDLYVPWKNFARGAVAGKRNARFPQAFRTTGGDSITTSLDQGAYFYLRNDAGWRIRPPEEDITINLTGNLIAEDSTLPVAIPTVGGFTALILGLQPITQGIEQVATDVILIRQMLAGKVDVTGVGPFVVTVFADDNLTVLAVINVSTDGKTRTRVS